MDKDLLEFYVNQGLSLRKISKLTNRVTSVVSYWLKKYNLKTNYKSFSKNNKNKVEYFCSTCNIKLNKENGALRTDRKGEKFYPNCKKCSAVILKEKRKKQKQKFVEYKGKCCANCGYDKNAKALELHHLDPTVKQYNPSNLSNVSLDKAKKEIDKCILLCSNCHREEHQKIDDRISLENNFKDFQLSNFSSNILTGKNTGKMSCYMCDIVLTEENLVSKKHTPLCKSCNSKRTVNRIKTNKIKAVEYMGGKCSHCGYNKCLRALEFHHLDPSKKSEDYDKNFTTWGVERQKEELKNCILLCSNCHREVHNSEPS